MPKRQSRSTEGSNSGNTGNSNSSETSNQRAKRRPLAQLQQALSCPVTRRYVQRMIAEGWHFTNDLVLTDAACSSRRLHPAVTTYLQMLAKARQQWPQAPIHTQIAFEFRQEPPYRKHSIALVYVPAKGPKGLGAVELFDSNGPYVYFPQNRGLQCFIAHLQQFPELFNFAERSIMLNTEDGGHCDAWALYFHLLREHFDAATTMAMIGTDPRAIYDINQMILEQQLI